MDIDLSGHVALVTGAAGELGRVITRTLATCGAAVAIHYHRSEAGARALYEETRATGARCALFHADITRPADVTRMQHAVVAELGAPDILVPNAVSQITWRPLLEQPVEDYADQFRTCVLQTVLLAKAFVPDMIKKNWGRIIAINTECAMTCRAGESAYAAGKRGLDALVRVLAKEIGPHQITVNEVAPGWMISDKVRAAGTERQPDYEQNVPLGHRGQDQDVANAVAFLASDLASFITGAYIPVCGGQVMPAI